MHSSNKTMKKILLIISLITVQASAQHIVTGSQRATNAYTVTVVEIYEAVNVSAVENGQLSQFPVPAQRLVSRTLTTNAAPAIAQKPVAAQRPTQRPAAKVKGVDSPSEHIVTAVPSGVNTNSPSFRTANKLPPYNK